LCSVHDSWTWRVDIVAPCSFVRKSEVNWLVDPGFVVTLGGGRSIVNNEERGGLGCVAPRNIMAEGSRAPVARQNPGERATERRVSLSLRCSKFQGRNLSNRITGYSPIHYDLQRVQNDEFRERLVGVGVRSV
jgi:hypothetical protein